MMSMLEATVYAELATVLRMPTAPSESRNPTMQIKLSFKAIPYDAMVELFPVAETMTSPSGAVTTGLIRNMHTPNQQINMEKVLPHGKGCCKLVLPETAMVGRSVLSFSPNWQI